jgi:hypothetical protein
VILLGVYRNIATEQINRIFNRIFAGVIIGVAILVTKGGVRRVEQIDARRVWRYRKGDELSEKVAKVSAHGSKVGEEGRFNGGEVMVEL